jgi:hypothetical protein
MADFWTSKGLHPYLAIAHWLAKKNGQIVLCQALLAFRHLQGAHGGQQIARIVFSINEKAGILEKVYIFHHCT